MIRIASARAGNNFVINDIIIRYYFSSTSDIYWNNQVTNKHRKKNIYEFDYEIGKCSCLIKMNMQNYGTTINDNIHEISNNNKEYSWLNE